MENILGLLGFADPSTIRVVTATIRSATGDVAMVETRDGITAMLPASEYFPSSPFVVGSEHQLLLMDHSPTPICSAVRPELISAIYAGFTPELRSGAVRIVSVARAAGVRSKVAVAATETGVDPVAALVGREANRVRGVGALLAGERLDIVPFHPDPAIYLTNALAPAAVTRVEISGETAVAFAPPHQMSAAVGAGGLNSQLAGQLLGLQVRIEQG